jgi:hypothetical protein
MIPRPVSAAACQPVRRPVLPHVVGDLLGRVQAAERDGACRGGVRIGLVPDADDPRAAVIVEKGLVEHVDAVVDDRDEAIAPRSTNAPSSHR